MSELKINKGVEIMMRGKKPEKKKKGFGINQVLSLLKRKVYINFEIRWEQEDS